MPSARSQFGNIRHGPHLLQLLDKSFAHVRTNLTEFNSTAEVTAEVTAEGTDTHGRNEI
jgi:hypothetical protein